MIKAKKYNIKLLDELTTIVQEELKFKLLFTEKHFDLKYFNCFISYYFNYFIFL